MGILCGGLIMVRKINDTKVRTLIRAYLVFNRGKKCSSMEISEWINNGGFGLKQYSVTPKTVSYHVNLGKRSTLSHILHDVNVEKVNGLNHFWIDVE